MRKSCYNDKAFTHTTFNPIFLHFSNKDVNKDGWMDITFHGSVIREWIETPPDVTNTNKKRRKINQITMTYLWNEKEDTWVLQEDYGKLNKIIAD